MLLHDQLMAEIEASRAANEELRKTNEDMRRNLQQHDQCSVRLTWDVFVRDLNRQLGTPSHWLPADSCKEGQKGALAAVCTPTLKSASKKHQKLCTSVSEHRVWLSEGGEKELCIVYIFSFWQRSFPSPLYVTSRLEQATKEFLENLPKVRPRSQHSQRYLNYPSI